MTEEERIIAFYEIKFLISMLDQKKSILRKTFDRIEDISKQLDMKIRALEERVSNLAENKNEGSVIEGVGDEMV